MGGRLLSGWAGAEYHLWGGLHTLEGNEGILPDFMKAVLQCSLLWLVALLQVVAHCPTPGAWHFVGLQLLVFLICHLPPLTSAKSLLVSVGLPGLVFTPAQVRRPWRQLLGDLDGRRGRAFFRRLASGMPTPVFHLWSFKGIMF